MAELEVTTNDLEEIGDSERLDEVVGGAEFQAFSDVLRCDHGGEQDDRGVIEFGVLPDVTKHVETVEFGHRHVTDDERGSGLAGQSQAIAAVGGGHGGVAAHFQDGDELVPDDVVILDDENSPGEIG